MGTHTANNRCMRPFANRYGAALLAVLVVTVAPALYAETVPGTVDLTQQFLGGGVQINGLHAVSVGGIVVLRGQTDDPAKSVAAFDYAHTLGYNRVANLIRIVDAPDDEKIERVAERQLATRTLDGCSFKVDSNRGVVTVAGTVRNELQKDLAMSILHRIDGVVAVRASLQR
jgi:osmotically-inducible protein OsmY